MDETTRPEYPRDELTTGIVIGYLFGEIEQELSRRAVGVHGQARQIYETWFPQHPLPPEVLASLATSVADFLERAESVGGVKDGHQHHAAAGMKNWGQRLVPPTDPLAKGELTANTLMHLISDLEIYFPGLVGLTIRVKEALGVD